MNKTKNGIKLLENNDFVFLGEIMQVTNVQKQKTHEVITQKKFTDFRQATRRNNLMGYGIVFLMSKTNEMTCDEKLETRNNLRPFWSISEIESYVSIAEGVKKKKITS